MEKKEDKLKDFLKSNNSNANSNTNSNNTNFQDNNPNNLQGRIKVDKIVADSNFTNMSMEDLPFSMFYPIGTKLFVRPLKTKEIESFSVVNENNEFDVSLKLAEVLEHAVELHFPDGSIKSGHYLFAGDKRTVLVYLSGLTIKNGPKLGILSKCTKTSCNTDLFIDLYPKNYIYPKPNEKILKYFDLSSRKFIFPLKNGDRVVMSPPTVLEEKVIQSYIFQQALSKKDVNIAFLEYYGWLNDREDITIDDCKQAEFDFSVMNKEKFMFIYDTIKMMNFEVTEVFTVCPKCSTEVSEPYRFPNGARNLFIIPNAFDEFIA